MRCAAETQSGSRCKRSAQDGSEVCYQHTSRLLRLIEGGAGTDADAPPAETIAEAAAAGDRRTALANLLDRLAKTLDDPDTAARDLASVSRRFLQVMEELEDLDARRAEESETDDGPTPDAEWEAV